MGRTKLTILGGIFSRDRNSVVNDIECENLRRVLRRRPNDAIAAFRDSRTYLAKVDIGAYGESGVRVASSGSVSMLAGEPLLAGNDGIPFRTRTQDLEALGQAWEQGKWEVLKNAKGVFCAAHYQQSEGSLTLIADKLCIRPLYYWEGEEYIVFATALRILEALSMVPKVMDLRGVAEIASMGYPLGTRTPYVNIFLLKAAEIVQFSDKRVSRSQYWRWDEIPVSKQPEEELLKEVYGHFRRAVARRLRLDTATIAFLSGGLDSRCVVAALRERNVEVHTLNFFFGETQDRIFSREFAEKVGAVHRQAPFENDTTLSMMTSTAYSRIIGRIGAQRPKLVWSGDGGSVGLGHVYMSQGIADLIRDGKIELGIKAFLDAQQASVVKGIFNANMAKFFSNILEGGIKEELGQIDCDDPARSFYIFLLLNDQRRHLSSHFEDIDLHRIEFHLPFFDSGFLSSVIECPIELCLAHRFYNKWLALFPSTVTSVPWQAYPGHEPCPLPIPEGLRYQWQPEHLKDLQRIEKPYLLRQVGKLLKATDFPGRIISRHRLRLASFVYRIGLRDYGYIVKTAQTYCMYWGRSGGNYKLP